MPTVAPTPPPPPPGRAAGAARPGWLDLPPPLRTAVADRLGSPVRAARPAAGGFTGGFAGVLETVAGERVFVKAAAGIREPQPVDWYAREAAVTAALPDGLAVARPRWLITGAGYAALCLDAVDGHPPGTPWAPAELTATLTAYARSAAALAEPPAALTALGLPRLADLVELELSWWQEIVAGREPVPPGSAAGALPLAELAALEALLPRYVDSAGVIHGDLRADNVLVDRTGAAWLCDWTWACHGPAWFDLANLLVGADADGLDADALFAAHPAGLLAPPDGLDAALAALAGYQLVAAAEPAPDTPAELSAHRRRTGTAALAWLARRRGWDSRFGLSWPTW